MRPYLKSLGLEPDVIEGIMAEYGKIVTKAKSDLEAAQAAYDEANRKNAELTAIIAETTKKGDPDDLKRQLAELQEKMTQELANEREAHEKTKTTYSAEKEANETDNKVAVALRNAGMNHAVIDKALKLYDRSIVKRGNDGSISNADEVLAHFKQDWAAFFGETTVKGADVATPPVNNAAKITMADIAKMTPEEINTRFDELKPIIAGKK